MYDFILPIAAPYSIYNYPHQFDSDISPPTNHFPAHFNLTIVWESLATIPGFAVNHIVLLDQAGVFIKT